MSNEVRQIIERILSSLTPEFKRLLSNEPAPDPDYPHISRTPIDPEGDNRILWEWITQDFRLVLEAIGRDPKALAVLTSGLPVVSKHPTERRLDPRTLPAHLQKEWERWCDEAARKGREEIETWKIIRLREVEALEKESGPNFRGVEARGRPALLAEKAAMRSAIEKKNAAKEDCGPERAALKETCDGLRLLNARAAVARFPQDAQEQEGAIAKAREDRRHSLPIPIPWYWHLSDEITLATEKVQQQNRADNEDWQRTFLDSPFAWLWGVWTNYKDLTNRVAPAGVPPWSSPANGILGIQVLCDAGTHPGEKYRVINQTYPGLCPAKVAKMLVRALEQLRDGPAGSASNASQTKQVPWSDDAAEYLPNTEAVKLSADVLNLKRLGGLLKPNGPMRYMRKGRRTKVHLQDFRQYIRTLGSTDISDDTVDEFLKGVEARKEEERAKKRHGR